MTMTIERTTLCICLHIHSQHSLGAQCMWCRCANFQAGSRKSSHRYQRGQRTIRKRIARLVKGDRILVGFPGHDELARTLGGDTILVQEAGSVTSHLLIKHVEDEQLRPVDQKTGALLATVLDVRRIGVFWVVDTDLGDLPPLPGSKAVHALTKASP
jgi:hypothetical protein